ncbi:MAG: lamin tail domain-containing protein [Anaerolineales bacterium]|nr:lamin tail domain-containing protein [Anaerolineales bacterium]
MKQWKRLLFYILVNVTVSATTMLGVLYLWENTNLKNVLFVQSPRSQDEETRDTLTTPSTFETQPPLVIQIDEIVGVGNLDTEYVRLKRVGNSGQEKISLQNWQIKDEDNHTFTILAQSGMESLELHKKGAVNIYTKQGTSNPIELYLGFSEPLWEPGETVTLIEPSGDVHDTFLIP